MKERPPAFQQGAELLSLNSRAIQSQHQPEIFMPSPVTEAEEVIASRENTRKNTQLEFRGTLALELIADEMTRLRAEIRTLREQLSAYARRRYP